MRNWLLRLFSFWPSSGPCIDTAPTAKILSDSNTKPETSKPPKTTRPRRKASKKPTAPKKPAGRKSSYLRRGRTRKD